MTYEMRMRDDGILWITHIGDIGEEETEAYFDDLASFLKATTEAGPLRILSDASQGDKYCPAYRKAMAGLMKDHRLGKVASVGSKRYNRVLGGFLMKASGRDNVRFFDTEEKALAWLKAES